MPALDGLRGLAAVVVVVCHAFVSHANFPAEEGTGPRFDVAWWLTWSPLHLLWEGTGAVMVFFVLSGYVLTLAARTGADYWRSYYPSRLLRLYLPVAGSVALALTLLMLFPRAPSGGMSEWALLHDVDITPSSLLGDATLWRTGYLNSALWSLRYEVLFSLALPAFIWAARPVGQGWPSLLAGVALIALSTWGPVYALPKFGTDVALICHCLPVFGLGVLLASNRDSLARCAKRRWMTTPVWCGAALVSVVLLTAAWLPTPLRMRLALTYGLEPWALTLAGATLLVLLFIHWPSARRFGETRVVQWLGTVSFSLYLVHEPILISFAFARPESSILLRLLVVVPLALIAAWAFHCAVERPAHRLARSVRANISQPAQRSSAEELATTNPVR